jgi:hypothetical protein
MERHALTAHGEGDVTMRAITLLDVITGLVPVIPISTLAVLILRSR